MRRFLAGVIRGDFNEPLLALAVLVILGVFYTLLPWQALLGLVLLFVILFSLSFAFHLIGKALREWADKNAK